jgi:pimeloyl-ACP methyl ester carboxylesterase
MTVHVEPTRALGPHPLRTHPRTSIGRVVVGSIAAGIVTALVLTLAVFPGATESVVTGSILVAFGTGWGLIAGLSARMTAQPQRWAAGPAVAMTVIGVALLVLSPQDAILTWVSWAWPPALLSLTGWMFVQMRRTLRGRGRWMLTAVLLVLVATSFGAVTQDVATRNVRADYPPPGIVYSVGRHALHLDCHGTGSPTVVLFNGLGEISATWARVIDDMTGTTRVCAYDRAGQGWSDDAAPQGGLAASADLHRLLAAADEDGPFVLVGHSTGGAYAMVYASQYPELTAGMVLLDSASPRQFDELPAYPAQYAAMRRGLAILPTLARVGLGPVLASASHLPAQAAERVDAMTSTVRAFRNGRDEITMAPDVFQQAQALTTLGSRPLFVLSTSESLDGTKGWRVAQDRLATLSTNQALRDVQATHAGVVDDEHGAAESVRAITAVVDAVRSGAQVTTAAR